ncbi:DEAD/DEAH box helicase family protein [Jiangella alkaliphila]|uniref:Type III restriction enzyme, res subunit n=1 Tax=Jiangella alkaliphila TaxID=419479 RepID=A0A1H2K6K6_9ACTN|nr:DEAD/DEAH box helicase family protein [Jiangella alkaliphila]SDU64360.1 Type III restriction enzyme, res subunit [Jiangella alkaliphila]
MRDEVGWAAAGYPRPFRRHQRLALDALGEAFAVGRQRAWVVLPPGAGKTLVGLEAARRLGRPIVVFGPNTAIQGQWVAAWREFTPAHIPAGTDRGLDRPVTALTYQALATFDPDAEVDEEGHGRTGGRLRGRLHENGRALVQALETAGPITLILDECHHLLEVWGRLLAELLDDLPKAHVIGLTGTPPSTLTAEQAKLVDRLFGAPLYSTSIPSVVREGHLAPFAELAWFTSPSPTESQWLAAEAERFAELQNDLLAPDFASVGLLNWLDERFVTRRTGAGQAPPLAWSRLEGDAPDVAAAALRFHHAGLLALPDGAVVREEHRHDPTAHDWVTLLHDWVTAGLLTSDDPRDRAAVDAIKGALPGIGYQLTKRGIRRGRSPVDRVLARSEATTDATVEILAAETANLGDRLRALVLCDHERAAATLPARLRGVIDADAGSARLVLARLLSDPRTAALRPVLVTGRAVAADVATARELVSFVREQAPGLDLDDLPERATGMVDVTGRWRSRHWVPLVTRFYETGATRALVGTRALLGEGWNAKGVNTLVDLTTATTPTAVVQTRGRALRTDPDWPEKVAHTWTVVCISEDHPGGTNSWDRFVRKHDGYFAVTDSGEIAAGVGHVDPRLSPFAPPPVAEFAAENALMLTRAEDRERVRALWQVGTPYRDELVHTIRVTPRLGESARPGPGPKPGRRPPALVPAPHGAGRDGHLPAQTYGRSNHWWAAAALTALLTAVLAVAALWWPAAVTLTLGAAAGGVRVRRVRAGRLRAGRDLAGLAAGPDPFDFACAVADALHEAGLSGAGAAAVTAAAERDGTYRLVLTGTSAETSAVFVAALDELLAPLVSPRYVVPRYIVETIPERPEALRRAGRDWLAGDAPPNPVVYHAVPSVLGVNVRRVRAFAAAWNRWVSAGDPVRTATPEGEGILLTHRGQDPFAATTALRVAWR